jgi:hypothetical protein
MTALLNICFKIGGLWLALRCVTSQRLTKAESLWLAAGLTLTYVCLVPDKYATLYSYTDWAVYQLPAVVLLLVPVAIDQMQRATARYQRRFWGVGAVLGTVWAAGSNEMTIALLGWLLLVGLGVSLYRNQRYCARIWLGLLLVLLMAGSIAVGAPGNYERMKTYGPEPYCEGHGSWAVLGPFYQLHLYPTCYAAYAWPTLATHAIGGALITRAAPRASNTLARRCHDCFLWHYTRCFAL